MTKHLLGPLAACILASTSLTAVAAVPPTSVEDCLKQLEDLVSKAHAIDLLDDQIDLAEVELSYRQFLVTA